MPMMKLSRNKITSSQKPREWDLGMFCWLWCGLRTCGEALSLPRASGNQAEPALRSPLGMEPVKYFGKKINEKRGCQETIKSPFPWDFREEGG